MRIAKVSPFVKMLLVGGIVTLWGSVAVAGTNPSTPFLGVYLKELDQTTREAIDFQGSGVLVQEVVGGSPAEKGGIKAGDIITRYQGIAPQDVATLRRMIAGSEVGATVNIEVWRDGKTKTLSVVLDKRPEGEEEIEEEEWSPPEPRKVAYLGVSGRTIEGEIAREYFGVEKGALVEDVVEGSPAASAGLKSGDVITKLGDQTISTYSELVEAIRDHKPGDKVNIEYLRKGKKGNVSVQLGEKKVPYFHWWGSGPIIRKKISIYNDGEEWDWEEFSQALKEALENAIDPEEISKNIKDALKEAEEALKRAREEISKELKEQQKKRSSTQPKKRSI